MSTEAPTTETTPAPPWGDEEFNAEKAWSLIQGLRADKEKLAAKPALDPEQARKLSEYDRLEQASKSDLQRANDEAARWQTEAERWRKTSVASRIEALAATDYADPSDAVNALDPGKYLGADGVVDDAAIKNDLADVLTRKPHYRRAVDNGSRLPSPNRAQGAGASDRTQANPAAEFAAILQGHLAGPR